MILREPEPRAYKTPAALRDGLEARLAVAAGRRGTDVGRLRRRVVFERLLVRLSADAEGHWVLKGGLALELRLPELARATRDLDLAIVEASDGWQVPDDIPAAPAAWDRDYTALVADLDVEARTVDTALDCVRPVWRSAVIADGTTTGRPANRLQR